MPDPNSINPGACLQVHTAAATRALYNAVAQPQLAPDLLTLNGQSTVSSVMDKLMEYERIVTYLQTA